MEQGIRRSANGCVEDDGIFKGVKGQNALRSKILLLKPIYNIADGSCTDVQPNSWPIVRCSNVLREVDSLQILP
jgi:hypothetical protein